MLRSATLRLVAAHLVLVAASTALVLGFLYWRVGGVIDAEQGAIDHYTRIIEACEGKDYVTQDMVITILNDEQEHLREFEGFLKEYEKK